MSLISVLPSIIEESRAIFTDLMTEAGARAGSPLFRTCEVVSFDKEDHLPGTSEQADENIVAIGDNIDFMKELLRSGFGGRISLIYIDPPFFSKANYDAVLKFYSEKAESPEAIKVSAYDDNWEHGLESYLRMLTIRFLLMRELLADDGCFWVHLDWHGVHYVKIILDEIFGEKNFINEVVWHYKSGGTSKKHYSRKHDTLLFYSKTGQYHFTPQTEKSYNRGYKPYRFKGVKEYRDDVGWYTEVNMKDVWQLDMVGRTAAERTGYATQKPEALLERIIESCSRPGDICADFFGGSGTMAAVANRLGRKFITCDSGDVASVNTIKRLAGAGASFSIKTESVLKATAQTPEVKIKARISPIELSDKFLLEIELQKYDPKNFAFPTDDKGKKLLDSLLHQDSLSLIEYWSIDLNYDGAIHRSDILLSRDKERLETLYRRIGSHFGRISVMTVDAFGNRTNREFDLSE